MVAGGSRGDVQPIVALARGIHAAGHDVTVAASPDAEELVTGHGVAFRGVGVSIGDEIASSSGREWITGSSRNPFRELRNMRRVYEEHAEALADGLLALAGSADLFVSGILSFDSVESLATHDGARHRIALLCPLHPTSDGRAGLTARMNQVHPANLTRTRTGTWLLSRASVATGRAVRRRLGMTETGPRGFRATLASTPSVLGVSPLLVPAPPDWPETVTVTGPWTLDGQDWAPEAELAAFLAGGAPPLQLGFGSMSVVQPDHIREVATAAARASGVRLLLAGTDLRGPDGEDVYGVGDLPHSQLFPRVRGVVHHGGAGTTHTALRAGVPQVAVPHIADQPFWGRRIAAEHLGPKPLPLHKLSADRLADRIRALLDTPVFAARASDVGALARAEDGVTAAVGALGLA